MISIVPLDDVRIILMKSVDYLKTKLDVLSFKTETKSLSKEEVNLKIKQLLDVYGNNILRVAYSYLHNSSDAEEILQETLIKFLSTMPEFESSEHEKAWLIRVAINLSKNRIKYNGIRRTDELSDKLATSQTEDLSFVWEAVKQLPQKYKEVIHLFYYEGYSTEEIANILQLKESTVRSNLHRGRNKLKVVLKEAYDFG